MILDSSAGNGVLTKATVPIYATGVLTCYIQVRKKILVLCLPDVYVSKNVTCKGKQNVFALIKNKYIM